MRARLFRSFSALFAFLFLAAAGQSAHAATFSIGGTVSGLAKSDSLTLENNGKNPLKVAKNGAYTYATGLVSGTVYDVTVKTQPVGQTCVVSHGKGTIAKADVTDIDIACTSKTYTIGVAVAGLDKGDSVTLEDNGKNPLKVTKDGTFKFTTSLAYESAYKVTVSAQPTGETCVVVKGAGTVPAADVTVAVDCTAKKYTIGGTLSGLITGASVTLEDNGANALKLTKNGKFSFAAPLAYESTYKVTVSVQPVGETCTASKNSGTVPAADVIGVIITCTPIPYTIGGSVSGLSPSTSVTLLNLSESDSATVAANGTFAFPKKETSGSAYNVTVGTQPTGETCNVTGGAGKVAAANVITIVVTCSATSPTTYTIGGMVSGLNPSTSVTLANSSDSDSVTVSANGAFAFPKTEINGAAYSVSVTTEPTGENCTIIGGSGSVAAANVTTIAISCSATSPTTYTIGGMVSGLNPSTSVSLANSSDSDSVTVGANGSFTFPKKEANAAAYNVTVTTQPTGETCTVTGGSGSVAAANVTTIAVTCSATSPTTYTIGGMVSGLNASTSVTLANSSDSDSVTVSANGSFTFPKKEANAAAYNVTVTTQPTGETCTVTGGSGNVAAANVTGISVACSTSGGGGGGGNAYWIPYDLSPIAMATPAGSQGLELVAGDKLASNPTPQVVTTDAVEVLATGGQVSVSGGVATYSLQTMMYADTNSSGVTQIYGLNLKGTSTVPKPTQIGLLSLPSTQQFCPDSEGAQGDLSQPDSLFVIIHFGTELQCIEGGGTYELVNYQDSASTAPTAVSFTTTSLTALYQSGKLTGLLVFDSSAKALDFYAYSSNELAATPSHVLTGLTDAQYVGGGEDVASLSTAEAFFAVTTSAPTNYLYRIDGSTTAATEIQNLGQSTVGEAVIDDTNIYYDVSTAGAADSQTDAYYQVALTGGTPKLLYTTPSFVFAGPSGITSYHLIGSNDSVLAFEYYTDPLTDGEEDLTKASATFYSVPVGTSTTTPTTLASYPAAAETGNLAPLAFLAAPSGSGISGNILFATVESVTAPVPPAMANTYAFEAVSIPLNGGTAPKPIANSVYAPLALISVSLSDSVFQVTGITDTDGGYGGGTANAVDVGTLADTPFTAPAGGDYKFPANFGGELFGISGNGIAAGAFANGAAISSGATTTIQEIPVAADLSSNVLWTGTALSNTFVYAY